MRRAAGQKAATDGTRATGAGRQATGITRRTAADRTGATPPTAHRPRPPPPLPPAVGSDDLGGETGRALCGLLDGEVPADSQKLTGGHSGVPLTALPWCHRAGKVKRERATGCSGVQRGAAEGSTGAVDSQQEHSAGQPAMADE